MQNHLEKGDPMQLKTNNNRKELKTHGTYEFPVDISLEILSRYDTGAFSCHWHPEIELTLVLNGEIEYMINENLYHLQEGDVVFCNSNALHAGHMHNHNDCQYISIAFNPRIIYGFESSTIQTKYITPVISNTMFSSFHFTCDKPETKSILSHIKKIYTLNQKKKDGYELKIQHHLLLVWIDIYQHASNDSILQSDAACLSSTVKIQHLKAIFDYIHLHYDETITLHDIGNAANLSTGECCRFFKKHTNQSIFDYILYYRIEKSLPLLISKDMTITEIACATGFSNTSYFSKIFKKLMNFTPKEYQKIYFKNTIPQ